jgi:maltose/maltodextrin transport system substrate-binding protein
MKKVGSKLLVSLLCMSSTLAFAAKKKLTIWTSNENVKNAIVQAKGTFEKEMDAEVEVTIMNRELTNQFKMAATSRKGPDILVWANDVVGELAESGLIEPLTLSGDLKKNYLKVAVDSFTYKGKVYGYPYDLEAVALVYNKKLVKQPPKTMEELLATAKKLTDKSKNQYGFLYESGSFFFSFPFLSAGGGYVFKDNNGTLDVSDIGLANKGAVSGGELIRKFIKEGIVPESTDYSVAFKKMTEGSLAMTINGPWIQADMIKNKIDYGVAPIPTIGGKQPRPFVGSHGFMIRRSSDNKDLAKMFVEDYLVSKKGIKTLYEKDPRGPCRSDVIDEIGKTDANLAAFMQSVKNGYPMPNVPEMSAVWTAMDNAIKIIIAGRETPDKALASAVQQIKSGLNDTKKKK